jgi:hypothetical protein
LKRPCAKRPKPWPRKREDARRARLGQSVEIRDVSRGARPAYAIGTPHPAGRHIEFGTALRPAFPWLMPLFWARSPAVKNRLRNGVLAALKAGKILIAVW